MVHIPSAFAYDFWLQESSSDRVEVSCLMPNGMLIMLDTARTSTLMEIKEDLWEEAGKYPLAHLLRDASTYMFSCVSAMAETQDLRDETRRICDVKPFCAVLKIVDFKEEEDSERQVNFQISNLLGKGVHEFTALNSPEVNDFRLKMKQLASQVARQRQQKSRRERLLYMYPPCLAKNSTIPISCQSKIQSNDGRIYILARLPDESTSKLLVPYTIFPSQLVLQILTKKAVKKTHSQRAESFVLKVCGRDEYLLEEKPVIQYLSIQDYLSRGDDVQVSLCSFDTIFGEEPGLSMQSLDSSYDANNDPTSYSTLTLRKNKHNISSWSIDDLFSFSIDDICRLNTDVNKSIEVGVQAGLYHGGKALCEIQKTVERPVRDGASQLNQQIQFDIQVCNIPRMARLCLAVYEVSRTAKGGKPRKLKESKQEMFLNPLAWVNTTVYDFKRQLKTGTVTFNMWTFSEDCQTDEMLQPLGTVVCNSSTDHATTLTLTFKRYHQDAMVVYPSIDAVRSYAVAHREPNLFTPRSIDGAGLELLRSLSENVPLDDMHEQDKKQLWALRYHVQRQFPNLLAKLLDCVEWSDHKQVAEAISLLADWPCLPVEKALELLDYAYADQEVRSFAVRCLDAVSDEDLSLFLLQLVQAIKHESYLISDLVEFLLRRALNNRKIGHFLFWHLRSEMSFQNVSVRFGLILEAYCRGSIEHIAALCRQIDYVRKMQETSESLRQKKDRDKARQSMQDQLTEPHTAAALNNVVNPLDPRFRFKGAKLDKCRVMDSKMRPLYIVMENYDPLGQDVYIIFKNGDDLRQDMLALQMIRIMDMLWKNEGLDLRMNPYGCVSTDYRVGLIEVVLNAETIANIQKEKGMFTATSAFSKGSLLAWLKDHNQGENQLLKAIEEFTLSCAGYCVATYVLGVADRHSDNIMVKQTGQLFHIDFGHILGHFKEKFGFRRERVPFVLTHDFVHVINKGQKDKKEALEFQIFQNHCEKAFLILRRHGGLILSLFAMMISTGLPELSSEADLNYLRETLVLEKSEDEALAHFRGKLCEALANSWKTSLNWASHNLAKNNKT